MQNLFVALLYRILRKLQISQNIISYFDSQFSSLVEVVVLANGVLQSKHLDVGTQRRLAETVRVEVELIFHHRYEVLKKSFFLILSSKDTS